MEAVNSYKILVNMLPHYTAVLTASHGCTFISISSVYIVVLEPSNFCVIHSAIHISIHFRLPSEVPLFMKLLTALLVYSVVKALHFNL